jgi:hypothetical protein
MNENYVGIPQCNAFWLVLYRIGTCFVRYFFLKVQLMNTRDRFKAVMSFKPVDRLPVIEPFPCWDKTLERWHGEGLPSSVSDPVSIQNFFGLDNHRWWWMAPPLPTIPAREGWHLNSGMVNDQKEYDSLVAPCLREILIDKVLLEQFAVEQSSGNYFMWMMVDGFWWFPRKILGIEKHLYAFYDEPDFLKRINEDLVCYNLRLLEEVFKIVVPDIVSFGEDMSYNHGPMLSKTIFDEFISPYYKRIVPFIKKHGTIPFVDSDGNVDQLISWLKEAEIMGISPLERAAGNDIVALRQEHPDFLLIGGFDKTVMHIGEDAVRAEFEALMPAMKAGGYIPAVDHQTPPEVSLQDYVNYVASLKHFSSKGCGQ